MRVVTKVGGSFDGVALAIAAIVLLVAVLWLVGASATIAPVARAIQHPDGGHILGAAVVLGIFWPVYVGPLTMIWRFFGWRRHVLGKPGIIVVDPLNIKDDRMSQLHDHLADMAVRAGLSRVPVLAIADDDDVNAFTSGAGRGDSAVVLNRGLLEKLPFDQVLAVIGHEIGHIAHRDVVLRHLLDIIPQALRNLVLLPADRLRWVAQIFGFGMVGAAAGSRDRQAGLVGMLLGLAIGLAALAALPLLLLADWVIGVLFGILDCALSRRREFRADAMGAALQGHSAMISALQGLQAVEQSPAIRWHDRLATAKIVFSAQPYHGARELWGLFPSVFQTHPGLADRIAALQADQEQSQQRGVA